MKDGMMMKTLGLLVLSILGLAAGAAKAEGRGCQTPVQNPYLVHVQPQPAPLWGWHSGQGGERWNDHIDLHQNRQASLIRYGVHTGQLTPREALRLMAEQREIDRLQRQFTADGHISAQERRRLELALHEARRNIREELHDRQYRW